MTTVIFSLGQLISSDVQILKDRFQSVLLAEGKTVSGEEVWKWLIGYLGKLRLDKITLDELSAEFNTRFSVSLAVECFTECFNSMCVIEKASLARISALHAFLKQHPDVYALVVSHTNFSHLNCIMKQLEPILPNGRSGIITEQMDGLPDAKLLFATSMYAQCEQHPDTLNWAMNTLKIDRNKPVISFLNTIKKVEHSGCFYYIPTDSNFNADVLTDKLNRIHALERFFSQRQALASKINDLQRRCEQEPSAEKRQKLERAHEAASLLYKALIPEGEAFLNSTSLEAYKQFQHNSETHIKVARKELSQHRGWLKLLNDLLSSLVRFFKNTEEHSSFFKTNSIRLLDEVQASTKLIVNAP
jgi:hypothetical protein